MNAEFIDPTIKLMSIFLGLMTIWIALAALSTWRRQLIGQKKADIAENILTLFIKACHCISDARTPSVTQNEIRARPRFKEEPDDLKPQLLAMLGMAYAPILRFEQQKEFWHELQASQYKFIINFTDTRIMPTEFYSRLLEIKRAIIRASKNFIEQQLRIETPSYKARLRLEDALCKKEDESLQEKQKIIWEGVDEQDEINKDLEEIMADLEKVCLPALR